MQRAQKILQSLDISQSSIHTDIQTCWSQYCAPGWSNNEEHLYTRPTWCAVQRL